MNEVRFSVRGDILFVKYSTPSEISVTTFSLKSIELIKRISYDHNLVIKDKDRRILCDTDPDKAIDEFMELVNDKVVLRI